MEQSANQKLIKFKDTPHKFGVVSDKQNGYILTKDGRQTFCHKTPPIPTQGSIAGQLSLIRMPCCTNCPMANIFELEDGTSVYQTSCDGINNVFNIPDAQKQGNQGNVIQMQ